jgi:peptidoglycan/LPS O-acetylase OafA/YrhL
MAVHLFRGDWMTASAPLRAAAYLIGMGGLGVDLFFVLSGFLITGILYDSLDDHSYFRKFYARRTLRIFPLYYGVLFVLILLGPWIGIHWHGSQWVFLSYLQNTPLDTPTRLVQSHDYITLDHFWSLAVEEQFYLIWPLVVFLVRKRKKLLWTSLVLSSTAILVRLTLTLRHTDFESMTRNTLCRMDSLLMGAALALALRGDLRDAVLGRARAVFFWMLGATVVLRLAWLPAGRHPSWIPAISATYLSLTYTVSAVGFAALIAWCLWPSSMPRTFFENRALRFFGKYSYGLYVLHYVALPFLHRVFRGWIGHFTANRVIGLTVSAAMAFFLSVVAAYLSYNLYEKQFLRLKRYFDYDRPERIPVALAEV